MKELEPPPDHRAYLPAVEPERQVTDWGRSERVEGFFDRTIYDFLYHYWFRVEVEGIEHVPSTGGALLVSNHSGAFPPDASMIAKAIKEEHSRPRALHPTVEHFFKGYPGLSLLVSKLGGVPAHPIQRLSRERWLRRTVVDHPQLVGATELRPVEVSIEPGGLKDTHPAAALGVDGEGRPIVVVCSTGVDLALVPLAADTRALHSPGARLVLAVPARDHHPATRTLVELLRDPAELLDVPPEWD